MQNLQINLRVPEEYRGLIHDVCRRLRQDPSFADRLKDLMVSGQPVDSSLRAEVEELKRRVRALERSSQQSAGSGLVPHQAAWTWNLVAVSPLVA